MQNTHTMQAFDLRLTLFNYLRDQRAVATITVNARSLEEAIGLVIANGVQTPSETIGRWEPLACEYGGVVIGVDPNRYFKVIYEGDEEDTKDQ